MAVSREQVFPVTLLVQIDGFGLPEVHRSNIIARVTREMQLQFGGRAHVTEARQGPIKGSYTGYFPDGEVVEDEVQQLGEESQVPPVRTGEAATGTGLGSIPDLVRPVRLSFQSPTAPGGAT